MIVPEGSEVERAIAAMLDFGDGRLGVLDSSFELPPHQFAEVVGERGRLILPRPFTPGVAECSVRVEVGDETFERRFAAVDQYRLEVEHFSDCVRAGGPVALPPAEALAQAEVSERLYRAGGYRWPRE